MRQAIEIQERRTSVDVVFDTLFEDIASLRLLPGTKISEAEIAAKLGVSRQPVRDAFNRLSNIDLLVVQPQKATRVKKFSLSSLEASRFARLAIELEVVRLAVENWDGSLLANFQKNVAAQIVAVSKTDAAAFHILDYDFHTLMCRAAQKDFATEMIARERTQIDRLCVLSLKTQDSMREVVADHELMVALLEKRDEAGLVRTLRKHLGRLDETIKEIHSNSREYFQD